MAPHKRTPGSVVLVGLLCAIVVGLPRMAHADLGSSDEPSKTDTPQGSDTERPNDSILDKKPADAAVASKNAQASEPFWQNWKFLAIAGGVVVVAIVAAVVVVPRIAHEVNGGDVRPCNASFTICVAGPQ